MDTPDDYTVVMHMKRVFRARHRHDLRRERHDPARFCRRICWPIYPNLNQVPFNAAPIGTGPYRIRPLAARRPHRLARESGNYFRGAPHIKQLTIKIIPDDNTTRRAVALARGRSGASRYRARRIATLASAPASCASFAEAPAYTAILISTRARRRSTTTACGERWCSGWIALRSSATTRTARQARGRAISRRSIGRTIRRSRRFPTICRAPKRCSMPPAGSPAPTACASATGNGSRSC